MFVWLCRGDARHFITEYDFDTEALNVYERPLDLAPTDTSPFSGSSGFTRAQSLFTTEFYRDERDRVYFVYLRTLYARNLKLYDNGMGRMPFMRDVSRNRGSLVRALRNLRARMGTRLFWVRVGRHRRTDWIGRFNAFIGIYAPEVGTLSPYAAPGNYRVVARRRRTTWRDR